MREIKCYGLHIKNSDFYKVTRNIDAIAATLGKKYDGAAIATSKNPMKYCASFVFKEEKTRDQAIEALKDLGIIAVKEIEPAYVNEKYVSDSWREGSNQ